MGWEYEKIAKHLKTLQEYEIVKSRILPQLAKIIEPNQFNSLKVYLFFGIMINASTLK